MTIKTITIPGDEVRALIGNSLQYRMIAEGLRVGGKCRIVMALEFDLAGAVVVVAQPDGGLQITQELRDQPVTPDTKQFMDQFTAQRGAAIADTVKAKWPDGN